MKPAKIGDYNPAGRLPITFPRTVGQCPMYYNLEPSGRGYDYVDSTGQPRYAFGYGLSYTTFKYSDLKITPEKGKADTTFTVSFDVENTGSMAGDEVAQMYMHDVVSTIVRPLKELKAFRRVTIQPGAKRHIEFALTPQDLSYLDASMKPYVEPGAFEIMIGGSSDDFKLQGTLEVTK